MAIRQELINIIESTRSSYDIIEKAKNKKKELINPLLNRVETYLKYTSPGKYNFNYLEVRTFSVNAHRVEKDDDEGAIVFLYDTYECEWYEDENGEDVIIPWSILDMSEAFFNSWVEVHKEKERKLQESKDVAEDAYYKEQRRKQYEELKKEFES